MKKTIFCALLFASNLCTAQKWDWVHHLQHDFDTRLAARKDGGVFAVTNYPVPMDENTKTAILLLNSEGENMNGDAIAGHHDVRGVYGTGQGNLLVYGSFKDSIMFPGNTFKTNSPFPGGYLCSFDATGKYQWTHKLPAMQNYDDIDETNKGDLIFTGPNKLEMTTPGGNQVWVREFEVRCDPNVSGAVAGAAWTPGRIYAMGFFLATTWQLTE